MKLYVHKFVISYFDYGSFLSTREGIAITSDGDVQSAKFQAGTVEGWLAKAAEHKDQISTEVGETVRRSVDYNPHGLM